LSPNFEVFSAGTPWAHFDIGSLIGFKTVKRSRDTTKLETEIPTTEPYRNFLFAINSPVTRERYSTRLRSFFVYIGIEGDTMEERCGRFVEKVRVRATAIANGPMPVSSNFFNIKKTDMIKKRDGWVNVQRILQSSKIIR
jgi:hypothetical protein